MLVQRDAIWVSFEGECQRSKFTVTRRKCSFIGYECTFTTWPYFWLFVDLFVLKWSGRPREWEPSRLACASDKQRISVLNCGGPLITLKVVSMSWRSYRHDDTLKAKFHYASGFEAGSKLVADRPDSVMEFGREPASSC